MTESFARGGSILLIMAAAATYQAMHHEGTPGEIKPPSAAIGQILPELPSEKPPQADEKLPSPEQKFRSYLDSMVSSDNEFVRLTALAYIQLMSESSEAVAFKSDSLGISVQFVVGLEGGRSSGYVIYISPNAYGNKSATQDAFTLRRAFLIANTANDASMRGNTLDKVGALSPVDMGAIDRQIYQEITSASSLIAQK